MFVRVYENFKHFEETCSVLESIRDVAGRQQNVRSDETVKHMEEAVQTSPSKSISVTTTKLKLFCVTSLHHVHDTFALEQNYTMTTVCTTVQDIICATNVVKLHSQLVLRKRTNFVTNGQAEKEKGRKKEGRKERKLDVLRKM
jgi:hypothetical protein